jgi:hypothetical protein
MFEPSARQLPTCASFHRTGGYDVSCERACGFEWSHTQLGVRGISVAALSPSDTFVERHISPLVERETKAMVAATGFDSLDALIDATVPSTIRLTKPMTMGQYTHAQTESEFLAKFKVRERAIITASHHESVLLCVCVPESMQASACSCSVWASFLRWPLGCEPITISHQLTLRSYV